MKFIQQLSSQGYEVIHNDVPVGSVRKYFVKGQRTAMWLAVRNGKADQGYYTRTAAAVHLIALATA